MTERRNSEVWPKPIPALNPQKYQPLVFTRQYLFPAFISALEKISRAISLDDFGHTVTATRSVLQSFERPKYVGDPSMFSQSQSEHRQSFGSLPKRPLVDQDPPFELKGGRGSHLRGIRFMNSLTGRKDHCSSGSTAWT